MPARRLVPLNTNSDCMLLSRSGILAVTTFEIIFLGSGVGWGGVGWGGLSLLLKPNHNSKIERHK